MRVRAVTTALILILSVQCEGQNIHPQSRSDSIRLLMAILSRANTSASLEFSGLCNNADFPRVHFPPTLEGPPLDELRDIFSENPNIQVTQVSDGIIRISDVAIPDELLKVRISRVHFSKNQATDQPLFDPTEATWSILRTQEVKQYELAHNIESLPEAVHFPHAPFTSKSPHILGDLTDVTVSQALDYLFKIFPGLWIDEDCPGSIRLSFFTNSPNWELALRDVERRNRIKLGGHN